MTRDLTCEPDIVGETIPGPEGTPRFQVEYRIGQGGQAWVYKALDQKLGRYVAIKILRPDGDDGYSEGYESRFTNEARMTAALACNYTMTVHDYGKSEINGFEYIIMVSEFITGVDLHTYITRHGALNRMECLLVLSQIAESLAEAHARGFIHRDLKSPNIMVEHDDGLLRGIKVLDFGIGKAITKGSEWDGGHTKNGDFILSPMFSSPEQVLGNPLGPPTDLYSLGVIAYHCLVGVHPYHHLAGRDNATGMVLAHVVSEKLIRLPEMFDGRPLTDIVHKLLEKDLERRYSDCLELNNDLENLETSAQPLRRLSGLRTPARQELASEPTQKLSDLEPATRRLDVGPTHRLADIAPTQIERPHETVNVSYSVARSAAQEFGDTRAIRSGVFDPLEDKKTDAFAPPNPEVIRAFELEQARKKTILEDASKNSSDDPVAYEEVSAEEVHEDDVVPEKSGFDSTQRMSEEASGSGVRRIALVMLAVCVLVAGVGLSGVFGSTPVQSSNTTPGATPVEPVTSRADTTPEVSTPAPTPAAALVEPEPGGKIDEVAGVGDVMEPAEEVEDESSTPAPKPRRTRPSKLRKTVVKVPRDDTPEKDPKAYPKPTRDKKTPPKESEVVVAKKKVKEPKKTEAVDTPPKAVEEPKEPVEKDDGSSPFFGVD